MTMIRQSTARTIMLGPVLDADGVAVINEVVASILASKNGGAPAALHGSATLVHQHTGHYLLAMTTTDPNTLGVLELSINNGVNAMPLVRLNVVPANVFDSLVLGSDYLDSSVVQWLGTAPLALASQRVQTDLTALSGSSIAADMLAAKNFSAHSDGVVVVADSTTDTGRAANLRTAYTAACALTPGGNALATDNHAKVLVPDGRYDFGTGDGSNHGLEVDTEFVDLFGLSGNRDHVVLTSQIATASRGTVEQTANDVRISGVTMDIAAASQAGSGSTRPAAYFPATSLSSSMKIKNCKFTTQNGTNAHAMRVNIGYSSVYVDCECVGDRGFGYSDVDIGPSYTLSGKCVNCKCKGNYGFAGGTEGTFGGICANCTSQGIYGFCYEGTLDGTCINCVSDGCFSFCHEGTLSGTCINCTAYNSNRAFAYGGTLSGVCMDCKASGIYNFAAIGTLSGTLIRCSSAGCAYSRNCEGATIEGCHLEVTTNNVDCLILKDDLTTVANSTILVKEGGTGVPIDDDGNARTVAAAGNRYNNLAQSTTGLGPNVTNRGIGDVPSALGTQAKANVNTEVDGALNAAIPDSPTPNSINKRIKTLDDDWADGGRLDLIQDAIPTTPMRGTDNANTVAPDASGIAATLHGITDGKIDALHNFDGTGATLHGDYDAAKTAAQAGNEMALVDAEDIYHADIHLTRDVTNTTDEYTVIWYKNGNPVTSGITVPKIQVVKRVDGTDLIAETAMTEIGLTRTYSYDEATNVVTAGEAVVGVATATIDAATRTWKRVLGRDST